MNTKNTEIDILGQELTVNSGSNSQKLSEGQHFAIVAGLTVSEMKKFDSDEMEPKVQVVFQVHGEAHVDEDSDEEGEQIVRYIKSRPYKISTHEKSGLMKDLMSWSKSANPAEVIQKLAVDGKFNLKTLLGKVALLTITHDKNGYENIDLIGLPKKSQKRDLDEDASVPEFMHQPKNLMQAIFLDNIKLGTKQESEESNVPELPEEESLPFDDEDLF
jgi:hypothetical protein